MISVGDIVYTCNAFNSSWYIEEILFIDTSANDATVRPIASSDHTDYTKVHYSDFTDPANTVIILGKSEAEARSNYPEYFI